MLMQQLLLVVVETGAEKMHFELLHRLNRTSKCLKAVTDPEIRIRFFAYRVYKSIGPAALEVNRPDIFEFGVKTEKYRNSWQIRATWQDTCEGLLYTNSFELYLALSDREIRFSKRVVHFHYGNRSVNKTRDHKIWQQTEKSGWAKVRTHHFGTGLSEDYEDNSKTENQAGYLQGVLSWMLGFDVVVQPRA